MANQTTFALVHGSWCGGFIFADVAERLRSRGHRVFTPTLSGLAERSHRTDANIGLGTHIEDIIQVIRYEDLENVVLAGHSYGGMVITGVADRIPDRISSLVYLDAEVPEDGQAQVDLLANPEGVKQILAAHERGVMATPMPPPVMDYLNIPIEQAWRYAPQPMAAWIEPIALTGAFKTISKKTYVWAERSPGYRPTYERANADPAWITTTIPTVI